MTIAELFYKLLFPRPSYGVWLPGIGWLRNVEGKPYADASKRVARSVARRFGNSARVEYIDEALSDPSIEQKLLFTESGGE